MPRVILVSKWILPFGYGITLRNLLLVRKDSRDISYVTAHEECHWRQWQLEGSYTVWLVKYIYFLFKYGYTDNPYEVKAREYGEFVSRSKKREIEGN